jgi:beta-N-acetylhexosaminidase
MTERFGAEHAGVLAVQAGHDALLKPADAIKTIQAVVAAVRTGEIPAAQIDESVRRLLYWKARLNLHRQRFVDEGAIAGVVGTKAHLDLMRSVAGRSLTVLVDDGVLSRAGSGAGKVLHLVLQRQDQEAGALPVAAKIRQAFDVTRTLVLRPTSGPDLYYQALRAASEADTVIVSVFSQRAVYRDNGALRDAEAGLVRDVVRIRPRSTIVMAYGNPYVAESVRGASGVVVGYGEGGFFGNQVVYADAFIDLIKGDIGSEGRLPVTVSSQFPRGAGIVRAPARAVSARPHQPLPDGERR